MSKKLLETKTEIISETNTPEISQEEIDNMERYKKFLENVSKLPPVGLDLTEAFVRGMNLGFNIKQTA